MNAKEIWIIGTEPPCPRCDYLKRMVQDVVNDLGLQVPVRHLSYTGEEARRFAAASGLEPGTAKDVARKASVDIDWKKVYGLIEVPGSKDGASRDESCCPTMAARWSPELDELLRPCEIKAREAGIMMTPVLVIGGRCVHQGSVPSRGQVVQWVKDLSGRESGMDRSNRVVEVLGPGCAKCDQLYENVLNAVDRAGLKERIMVKKRTDIGYFHKMGVAVTPGLIIDGQVVSKGRVLPPDQIVDILQKRPD
jgi:small redox-active disulfide protein 2